MTPSIKKFKNELNKKLAAKKRELLDLEMKLREAQGYIMALEETLREYDKDEQSRP